MKQLLAFLIIVFISPELFSQNEATKWYFGHKAALDFSTNPLTVLNNSAMYSWAGSASVADANGNLLFYTKGDTIWNKQHGTGLFGNTQSCQSSLIVKQPGSMHNYYVFTTGSSSHSFYYSIVDMSLAAGMGSVTTKNVYIHDSINNKLAGTRHCNGTDIWVLTSRQASTNTFLAFLLTSSGLNTVAVVSTVGTYSFVQFNEGQLKLSPNGSKIANAKDFGVLGTIELSDFDKSTGIVSNMMVIANLPVAYGVEFSPDGSKLYGARPIGSPQDRVLFQWDLCAGSPAGIIASKDTIAVSKTQLGLGEMQLGPDGKIYIAHSNETFLGVINDPNKAGSLCQYADTGQYLGLQKSVLGLPNFLSSSFKPSVHIASSASCKTVSFTLPTGCSTSPTGFQWTFGDPASASANTSTLAAPIHTYGLPGTYTVQLIKSNSPCASDTLLKVVTILASPILSVTGNFTLCPNQTATVTLGGAHSYSWNIGSTLPTLTLSPPVTTIYTVTGTYTTTNCADTETISVVRSPCTSISKIDDAENTVKIYPNPFKNTLSIDLKSGARIFMYNPLGMLVSEFNFKEGINSIDATHYANGVYLFRIELKGQTFYTKLIKTE